MVFNLPSILIFGLGAITGIAVFLLVYSLNRGMRFALINKLERNQLTDEERSVKRIRKGRRGFGSGDVKKIIRKRRGYGN